MLESVSSDTLAKNFSFDEVFNIRHRLKWKRRGEGGLFALGKNAPSNA